MDTDVMVLGAHRQQRFTFRCDKVPLLPQEHILTSVTMKTSCAFAALEIIPEIELVNKTDGDVGEKGAVFFFFPHVLEGGQLYCATGGGHCALNQDPVLQVTLLLTMNFDL